jgi:23S rRNA pseudouridine955/2504/2580 synthase
MIELTAGKDDSGRRLDRILRKALPDLSLSLIHRLLRQKKILVDDKPATPNYRIEQGMVIKVYVPATHSSNQVNKAIVNHNNFKVNNILLPNSSLNCSFLIPHCSLPPVPVLWQGSGIIVFNKPQGLSTHGQQSLDSIVNAWLESEATLPHSLSFRPGPLHRLDKPTSGAIAFSQTLEGARLFSSLLKEHKLEKVYIAIVEGNIEKEKRKMKSEKSKYDEIICRDSLEHDKNKRKSFVKPLLPTPHSLLPIPKEALTTVKTLATNGSYSLIEARIKTGRHHQIRAQAAAHGHPLAGDTKYGASPLPGQTRGGSFFLHAWKIKFIECPDGLPREIIAPLPEAFQSRITELFGKQGITL